MRDGALTDRMEGTAGEAGGVLGRWHLAPPSLVLCFFGFAFMRVYNDLIARRFSEASLGAQWAGEDLYSLVMLAVFLLCALFARRIAPLYKHHSAWAAAMLLAVAGALLVAAAPGRRRAVAVAGPRHGGERGGWCPVHLAVGRAACLPRSARHRHLRVGGVPARDGGGLGPPGGERSSRGSRGSRRCPSHPPAACAPPSRASRRWTCRAAAGAATTSPGA